ncbi:MAG TPA: tetratricopeptide repeat protein [Phycisphaerae bacterium]|nr:tetratricopeptide repeat protein [Phycisphaerae bacterium]
MPGRLFFLPMTLGLASIVGCALDKEERVAQTGMEEEKSRKADSAKPAPPPTIMSDTHIAAGKMLEKQGDLTGAIAQYERAIASSPRAAVGYNRLGIVYQKLGRFADAENIFRQGAGADPTSAALLNNLGYCYQAQKRLPEAEQAYRDALVRSQDFQRARMNLAIVLAQLGRLEESVIEFSRVVAADAAHYNVAMVCLQKRDYAGAEHSLREALAINPNCPGAEGQLRRVAHLAAATSPEPSEAPPPPVGPLAGEPETVKRTDAP